MKVSLVHDRLAGPNVTKNEDDFYDEEYHDYSKVEKGGFSGWEIYKSDYGYQVELIISEADDNGKGYAILFEVTELTLESALAAKHTETLRTVYFDKETNNNVVVPEAGLSTFEFN